MFYSRCFLVLPETIVLGRIYVLAQMFFKSKLKFCCGFLVRPKTIVFGRTYVLHMMFFSEHEISEMREPTGLKFCTMVSIRPNFIMPVQNFERRTPKKFRGRKNMQNLARFRTTLKFGGEYRRNG